MPIENEYTPVRLESDGIETDFDFGFRVTSASEIKVSSVTRATNVVAAVLVLNTDYTVTISPVVEGGTVVLGTALANTQDILIESVIPNTQTYGVFDSTYNPRQMIGAMDRMCRLVQQVYERTKRALKFPVEAGVAADVEIPAPESLKLIGWNEAATALENKDALSATAVTDAQSAKTAAEAAQAAAEVAQAAAEAAAEAAEAIAGLETASQVDAEAGTNNTKMMTPLRSKQAIDALQLIKALASQAEAEAGTENTKGMTALRVAQAIAELGGGNYKIFTGSRDLTTAAGTQAITGIGFTPSVIFFMGAIDTSSVFSIAVTDGTTYYGHYRPGSTTIYRTTARCLLFETSIGVYQSANLSSLDADGFTLNWIKNASPTGVGYFGGIAFG